MLRLACAFTPWNSDHGYKLGEHCDWFKHDNYEDSTRIVTIIKPADGLIPNMRARGEFVEQLVRELLHDDFRSPI